MINSAQIRRGGHHSRSQQTFDLGGEQKPVALSCPIERAYAEAISPQDQLLFSFIPQRDGKLPAQVERTSLPDSPPRGVAGSRCRNG